MLIKMKKGKDGKRVCIRHVPSKGQTVFQVLDIFYFVNFYLKPEFNEDHYHHLHGVEQPERA